MSEKAFTIRPKLFFLIMIAALLGGCWDYVDLENRAFVLGFGVDLDDESPGGGYIASIEIPNTSSSQDSSSGTDDGAPKLVVSATGNTLAEAVISMGTMLPLSPSWGQVLAVIVSEDVAEAGINHILDLFIRNVRINMRARLYVAEGKAKDFLMHQSSTQPVTAQVLRLMENHYEDFPRFARPNPIHLAKRPAAEGPTLVPRLVLEKDMLVVAGAAVLKEGRMVGWLDELETEGANWLTGDVRNSQLVTECPDRSTGSVAMELRSKGRRIRLDRDASPLHLHITLAASAQIVGLMNCPLNPVLKHAREQIASRAESELINLAQKSIEKSQDKLRTDFLEIGVFLQREHPGLWESLDWEELYPDVRITVDADITVTDPGSINEEARI